MSKNILVLGSQKNLILPKIKIDKLYAANGSIYLADQLKKENISLFTICVTGAAIYLRHAKIRKIILKSKPNKFIIRGSLSLKDIKKDFDHDFDYHCFSSKKKLFDFQKNFFNRGMISILTGEFFYEKNFFKKIFHLFKIIFFSNRSPGVSTGFFSILLALSENPNSKIIISGISMKEGSHFFKKKKRIRK